MELDEYSTSQELREALRRKETALLKARAKSEDLVDAVYRAAKDVMLMQGTPAPVKPPKLPEGKGREEIALIHFTDPQYGKLTETYNVALAEHRILDMFTTKISSITRNQRADHPVTECHVMLGGDFTEGVNIFPGQVFTIEKLLFEQLFGIARITEQYVRTLLTFFDTVHVWQEEGNHGRISKKGDFAKTDNTDLFAYEIARLNLVDQPRLIWHPRQSWYQHVVVGNYHAVLVHGDEFNGSSESSLIKKGTAWASGVIKPFRDIYFGHFHTHRELPLPNGGMMFGTGSTESDNEYAEEFVAAKGPPSQRLHFINPDLGRVTAQYRIWLDE